VGSFKNLLFQNHWVSLPDLESIILGGKGFKFLQMKGISFLEGEVKAKELKFTEHF
jgi:hypothetical protein